MRFSLLTRAAENLVKEMEDSPYELEDCKLKTYKDFRKNGFISIAVLWDGNFVAGITQDIYSAECSNKIEEAEKFLVNKINKIYGSR